MNLLASPAAGGLARTLVEQRLLKWDLLHIADDAFLVTSELVTNATRAARGRELAIRFSRDDGGVLLEVWDPSDEVPRLRQVDLAEDDVGGWGLQIVQALAARCGYTRSAGGGKTVWALLRV